MQKSPSMKFKMLIEIKDADNLIFNLSALNEA